MPHVTIPYLYNPSTPPSPQLAATAPRLRREVYSLLNLLCIFTTLTSLHNMSSSYNPDAYRQPTQFHPATLFQIQPDSTRVYQNPTSIPSNPSQPRAGPIPSQPQEPSRPHSIAELAEIAKHTLGDDHRPFKTWLRIAENARHAAKNFQEQGDLESAFIEFAKAATIVLEKIPAHRDYRVLLSSTQRHNMGLVSRFRSLRPPSPPSPCTFVSLVVGTFHMDALAILFIMVSLNAMRSRALVNVPRPYSLSVDFLSLNILLLP